MAQDNLFDIPDAPGVTVARQIATLFFNSAEEYGYPPLTSVDTTLHVASFVMRAEDGNKYVVTVTDINNLVGAPVQ